MPPEAEHIQLGVGDAIVAGEPGGRAEGHADANQSDEEDPDAHVPSQASLLHFRAFASPTLRYTADTSNEQRPLTFSSRLSLPPSLGIPSSSALAKPRNSSVNCWMNSLATHKNPKKRSHLNHTQVLSHGLCVVPPPPVSLLLLTIVSLSCLHS